MLRIGRLLLVLLPLALLVAACSSYEPPKPDTSALSKLDTGIRHDCNAMLNTAFRAPEERQWFEQNCSKWPAVAVAQIAPAAAPAPGQPPVTGASVIQGETPECAARRGKPYASEQDRTWFLQNCIRPEVQVGAPSTNAQTAPNGNAQAPVLRGPAVAFSTPVVNVNAAVCDTLRRTPNPSPEQSRWYFANCNR